MVNNLLFGNNRSITRRVYTWNLCASIVYSVQSAIYLLVVTRVGGLVQAGVFTILYTVTQTLASMGSYSMRNFHASDVKEEYSFSTYYSSRIITSFFMVLACAGYGLIRRIGVEKFLVLMFLSFYRVVDAIEDVFHGEVQRKGRLDVASVATTIRIVSSVVVFCVLMLLSKDLVLASLGLVLTSVLVFLSVNHIILRQFETICMKIDFRRVFTLLFVCFPVFAGAIAYNYLVNVPKYAIDRLLGEEWQTIFSILFLPVFVTNILSMFIFKPMVKQMGEWWNDGKIKTLLRSILKQTALIAGITVVVAGVGYLFGCRVLGFIYGVSIMEYSGLFAELLCYGGVAALATFFGVVLTIMRRQILVIVGYAAGFVVSLLATDYLLLHGGIYGAGRLYGCIMGTVFFVFCVSIVVIVTIRKKVVENGKNA